jgi:3-hydroxymyristoyl/3-hydroxydecanoyl-(acyl carrier protein) dehydratase
MNESFAPGYELRDLDVGDGRLTATLFLPENLIYFDGHFDGKPVLPGVVQLKWAVELAAAHLGVTGGFHAVDMLKFTRIIPPGSTITVDIRYCADTGAIEFDYSSEHGRHSSGKARFA